MVWFVCKMRLRHMCTFESKNLMVKGLIPSWVDTQARIPMCESKQFQETTCLCAPAYVAGQAKTGHICT